MKLILSVLLLSFAINAAAGKVADIENHFNLINQCKFDAYQNIKKDVENQRLKIKVDAKVSNASNRKNFGIENAEDKNNNYECLRKLSQYK